MRVEKLSLLSGLSLFPGKKGKYFSKVNNNNKSMADNQYNYDNNDNSLADNFL